MATAILKEIFEIELKRTRDPKVLSEVDIVYDVGGGKFDHHDIEKVYREDGIPYASCGLIWKEFGRDVIYSYDSSLDEDEIESALSYVDRVLVEGIDALDNGIRPQDEVVQIMSISSIISGFNPPWHLERSQDEAFNEAVEIASKVLKNTINNKFAIIKSKDKVISAYETRKVPEILILDRFCPWRETLREIDEKEEVLFVIYQSKNTYEMQTLRGADGKDRKPLPKAWAGKRDEQLAAITGVRDAIFCHTGRFIVVAKSSKGIMKLAQLAMDEPVERTKIGFINFIRKLFLGR